MADFSTCASRSCRAVTPGIVDKCPVCGARVQTSRRIRILGWLSIACGLFLVAMMGYISMEMYPTLSNPGASVDGGHWTGTAEQARMALNLFYLVIGFGVLATAAGSWMMITGRRHIAITIVTLLVAAILIFQTWETTAALKQAEEEAEEPRRYVQPPPMTPVNLGAPAPDKPAQ
jgi:hypothetical protein